MIYIIGIPVLILFIILGTWVVIDIKEIIKTIKRMDDGNY